MIRLDGNKRAEKIFSEARNLLKKGNFKKAKKKLEFLLTQKINISKVLLNIGILEFYNLNISESFRNFQNVIGLGNPPGDVYFYLGKIFKLINNETESIENFKKGVAFSQSEVNKLLSFEEIKEKVSPTEREELFKKATNFYVVRTTITNDEDLLTKAIYDRITGNYEEAINKLNILIENYPDFFQGYLELAKTYEHIKKPHLSYKILKQVKKSFGEILVSLDMPRISFRLRKYRESLYYNLKYQLKKIPENYKIYLNIATCFSLINNDNKAINFYKKAIAYNPFEFYPYYNIGAIYQKNGLIEEALEYYKEAYNINSNNVYLNFNIGLIYFEKGNYFEALYYFNKAYENDNKFIDAKTNFESVRIIKTVENNFSPDLEFSLPYKLTIGISVFMIVLSFIYIIKWL